MCKTQKTQNAGGVSDPRPTVLASAKGVGNAALRPRFDDSMFSLGRRKRSGRITLTRLGFADIDPMFETLRAVV